MPARRETAKSDAGVGGGLTGDALTGDAGFSGGHTDDVGFGGGLTGDAGFGGGLADDTGLRQTNGSRLRRGQER